MAIFLVEVCSTDSCGSLAPMGLVPLWLKVLYSVFIVVVFFVYRRHYGWANFLWFSDIALFLTAAALWLESSLLASMMALAILVPEVGWNLDFWPRLLTGKRLLGLADYMFEQRHPLWIRAISLFHVVLPPLLVWLVWRLGYETWALPAQTAFGWAVLVVTWVATDPQENINWVYGPRAKPQQMLAPWAYLLVVMVAYPVLFYLPAHFALWALFRR